MTPQEILHLLERIRAKNKDGSRPEGYTHKYHEYVTQSFIDEFERMENQNG